LLTNEALFRRLSAVSLPANASAEDRMLLAQSLKAFERHGARLDSAAKARLLELDQFLGTESLAFSDNLLKDSETWYHALAEAPAGLPDWALEQAADAAKQHSLSEGYAATLDAPNYLAFMTHADSPALRELLWRAYSQPGREATSATTASACSTLPPNAWSEPSCSVLPVMQSTR
jgi:Zn-dependent oligopeptidases